MARTFWFAITVLVLVCFLSAVADWLACPPDAAAMAEAPTDAPAEAQQQAPTLEGSAPVIQVTVAVVLGLFGVLSMAPLVEEKGRV